MTDQLGHSMNEFPKPKGSFRFHASSANVRFGFYPPTVAGCKYSVTTDRFQESESHRLLSGDESEEMTVTSRPTSAMQLSIV